MYSFKKIIHIALCVLVFALVSIPFKAKALDFDDDDEWLQKSGAKLERWFAKKEKRLESWVNSILLDHPNCTREELSMALPYARLVFASDQIQAKDAQVSGWRLMELDDLGEFLADYWNKQECWVDDDHCVETHTFEGLGVRARIYEKANASELVVVFTGSETDLDRLDRVVMNWASNLLLAMGKPSLAYSLAEKWVADLKSHFPNHLIIFTGQSFGAGIAQYLGVFHKLPAVCFNSPGIRGASLDVIRKKWDPEGFHDATRGIQHVHVSGEILNGYVSFLPGRRLGKICEVEAHDTTLTPFERHQSEHVLRSIQYALSKKA